MPQLIANLFYHQIAQLIFVFAIIPCKHTQSIHKSPCTCNMWFYDTSLVCGLSHVTCWGETWHGLIIKLGVDSFTVPLHSPNGLPLGLCEGTASGVWKTVGIPSGHVSPWCSGTRGNPNLYLDQPIAKAWCQPIGGQVSCPTESPIATLLGLCSNLIWEAERNGRGWNVSLFHEILRAGGHHFMIIWTVRVIKNSQGLIQHPAKYPRTTLLG